MYKKQVNCSYVCVENLSDIVRIELVVEEYGSDHVGLSLQVLLRFEDFLAVCVAHHLHVLGDILKACIGFDLPVWVWVNIRARVCVCVCLCGGKQAIQVSR